MKSSISRRPPLAQAVRMWFGGLHYFAVSWRTNLSVIGWA